MEFLQYLMRQLGNVVSAFEEIAFIFSAPLSQVATDYPIVNGLVGKGMLQVIANAYPGVTLFSLMFTTMLGVFIVYTLIKWLLDIIL